MQDGASAGTATRSAVGIFDSGVGGLTVVAALHRLLPTLPIRYLADTAYFPYGERTAEEVEARSVEMAARLVAEGCSLLVVACNTASSAALERLRAEFEVPIVGMEPPLKPAVQHSRSGHVAVLVTPGTARGARLARLNEAYAGGAEVLTLPMPGLADLVEDGEVTGARVETLLRDALDRIAGSGVDAVALGCTHYGFVRETIEARLGRAVEVVDAAEPVARRVQQQLEQHGIAVPASGEATVEVSVTGDPGAFERTVERLRAAGVALPPLRVRHQTPA